MGTLHVCVCRLCSVEPITSRCYSHVTIYVCACNKYINVKLSELYGDM
jgi:hypothetical protein